MEYVLETNALTKHYRVSIALDGLTMCIPQGAMYGFVGRNGAGKTTLIRLICGLQAPTGGSYTLYGAKYPDSQPCPRPPPNGRGSRDALDLPGHDGGGESPPAVPGAGPAVRGRHF